MQVLRNVFGFIRRDATSCHLKTRVGRVNRRHATYLRSGHGMKGRAVFIL